MSPPSPASGGPSNATSTCGRSTSRDRALLYQEAATQGGPFAAEVAELRGRIAAMVSQLLQEASEDGTAESPSEIVDSFAHTFVGAGESLANWWLAYPDMPVDDVPRRLMDFAWMCLGDLIEGRTWAPDHLLGDT